MSFDQIVQLIGSVGFPIVMCFALCYYIYKSNSEMTKAINDLQDAIQTLVQKMDN